MRFSTPGRLFQIAALLFAGVISLWIFYEVGDQNLSSYSLGLGSIVFMSEGYALFLVFWSVLGTLAALFFGGAFALASDELSASAPVRALHEMSDRKLIAVLSVIGLCIPVLVRWRVLQGADIADDETAYRFMAELLASGRLYTESPPMKLFFDRAFMINDGKFYSQYFLGWPALLAPGVVLGVPSLMNPLYSALTVPPLFLLLRRLAGRRAAVIGALVFLSAPLLQLGAATQLSHTSCLFALTWASYFAVRIYLGDDKWWLHTALASSFSVAFFVRPSSALALGLPLLAMWLVSLASLDGRARLNAIIAFIAPAAGFGAAFLAVNLLQNGSPTHVSYQRSMEYARENGFRFAAWNWLPTRRMIGMSLGPLDIAAAQTGVTLARFNYALFGWPIAFIFLPFAGWRNHRAWIAWAMFISFAALHFFMRNGGIDTFGPVHYTELALPTILLTALGVDRLSSWLRKSETADVVSRVSARAPVALCVGLIAASFLGYTRVRAAALQEVASVTGQPQRAAEAKLERPTVVFASRPFVPKRCSETAHFLNFRPNNDPALANPVLWVNHITLEHDEKLMALHPDRDAVVMVWSPECDVVFHPLLEIDDPDFPPGVVGGSGEIPRLEDMR